jgi:hypothetical protein
MSWWIVGFVAIAAVGVWCHYSRWAPTTLDSVLIFFGVSDVEAADAAEDFFVVTGLIGLLAAQLLASHFGKASPLILVDALAIGALAGIVMARWAPHPEQALLSPPPSVAPSAVAAPSQPIEDNDTVRDDNPTYM